MNDAPVVEGPKVFHKGESPKYRVRILDCVFEISPDGKLNRMRMEHSTGRENAVFNTLLRLRGIRATANTPLDQLSSVIVSKERAISIAVSTVRKIGLKCDLSDIAAQLMNLEAGAPSWLVCCHYKVAGVPVFDLSTNVALLADGSVDFIYVRPVPRKFWDDEKVIPQESARENAQKLAHKLHVDLLPQTGELYIMSDAMFTGKVEWEPKHFRLAWVFKVTRESERKRYVHRIVVDALSGETVPIR